MNPPLPPDLRTGLRNAAGQLRARDAAVRLDALAGGHGLSLAPEALDGANVLIRTHDQLSAALALIALDGVAARLVIAPPDLQDDHLPAVIERAGIDTIVGNGEAMPGIRPVTVSARICEGAKAARTRDSEWVLFTSGTTGMPRMVVHALGALTGAIRPAEGTAVWGTFYDIRRYGGLQILLRALLGRASLVLSDADEPVGDFLERLGRHGVTHLTGTPSTWRRALMSPAIGAIDPHYVRLSGEIADQGVLDRLKKQFPKAAIAHAYASTEAGVGFEVTDGREGFPATLLNAAQPAALNRVDMKVADGTLHIRSPRAASRYLGSDDRLNQDGWVDSGDMVEQRGGRCYFTGRRGGIINVGGLKIHPEEVEAVINRHPAVRLSRVSGRKNPILGALVMADIVLADKSPKRVEEEILSLCRAALPAFKVPAMLRVVEQLELTAGGKLARHG